jgi:hypothetical protein
MEAGGGWVQRRLLRRTAVVGDGRTDNGRGRRGDRERCKPCPKTGGFRLGKYERVRKRKRREVRTRSGPGGGDLHELFERDCITKSGVHDSGMPELLCVPR